MTKPPRGIGQRQAGLSILEVLIALVILSIGLAGLAGMHMNSLKYVHSAYYRSIASAIALDFEERLWLRMADNTIDCPNTTAAGTTHSELLDAWTEGQTWAFSSSAPKLATIRSVTVSAGADIPSPPYAEFPVTVTWTDQRFDDPDDLAITDESSTEQFVYNVRILCKSSAYGTAPTEPAS